MASGHAHPRAAGPWVCLIYHDVTPHEPAATGGPEYFAVSARSFRRQLDLITELGMRGCSIADALQDPRGAVGVSFDDGDLGQAVRAFPALAERGMTATFFVTTSWVGTPGYASWDQLREMRAAGMAIESHTHTHPFLSELGAERLRDEFRRSRDLLDERLSQRTTMIAFPGGDAPRASLRHLLAEEGYAVVGTSRWGSNHAEPVSGLRYLKRCTVRGAPPEREFRSVITADGWMSLRRQARERALHFVRASLGPSRYARWRRRVIDLARSGKSG